MHVPTPPGADPGEAVTIAVVVDVAPEAVAAFRAYESLVLPMLARHRGRLDRRVRDVTGRTELHLLTFADRAGFESFLADPARGAHRGPLSGLDIRQRVLEVHDVPHRESFPAHGANTSER